MNLKCNVETVLIVERSLATVKKKRSCFNHVYMSFVQLFRYPVNKIP